MKNKAFHVWLACGTMMAGYAAFPTAVMAQNTSSEAAQERNSSQATLGDIIVTAQKRQQTLQDVPIAVSVLSSEALTAQHVNSVESLNTAVPNLVVTRSPFQPFVSIRGLGSGAGTRAFEQSVAMYVDGVYAGRANQFLNPFFDVERVEVVRGPQSVLFGVNAIAGAINVVNKRPEDKLEGYVTGGYEFAYEGYNIEGGVSLPLSDTFGIRVAGKVNREGAYLKNTVTNEDEPQTDSEIGRIVASWRPSSDVRVDLSYEHAHKKIDGSAFQTVYLPAQIFPPAIEDGKLDLTKSTPGTPNFTRIKTDNVTLNISWDVGDANLSSSSGYSHYSFSQALPAGSVPMYFGTALAAEKFDQFYQEVRLASSGKQFIDYIVGASYYHQRSKIDQGVDFDFSAFGASGVTAGVRNGLDQKTDGYSVFAQGTVNFTDQLNLVLGGRYSSILKRADYVLAPAAAGSPLAGYAIDIPSMFVLNSIGFFSYLDPADVTTMRPTTMDRRRRFTAFNPSVSLNYKFSPELSGYASFTTGTKAGGFNDQEKSGIVPENGFTSDAFSFNREKAHNFEIGLKANTGQVRANIAAFYTKYKDLQASQALANGSIFTTNAASATAKGIEADVTWLVAPGFTLGADAAYIHARYDDYPGAGCIITVTPTSCVDAQTNAKGGRLDGVPEFVGSMNASYTFDVGDDWEIRTRGRVHYNDGAQFQSNQDPLDRVPSYTLFDASIALAQREGGWSMTLSGKNLGNKIYRGFSAPAANPAFGHQSLIMPGRQVYLDLRFEF
ncbi:MAG: TonB-dependent receptor [Sphingobium sp.]|nr:TonB-dependent receptor [Sphingobium sp.]